MAQPEVAICLRDQDLQNTTYGSIRRQLKRMTTIEVGCEPLALIITSLLHFETFKCRVSDFTH